MKTKGVNLPNIISLLLLCLVALVVLPELFLPRGVNPVALTRHNIEQCRQAEAEVIFGVRNGTLPAELKFAFGAWLKQSETFKQSYLKMSEGDKPVVLDAWKQPLNIMAKSNLLALPNVSPALLKKTNEVIIWSSGPDGINEFGNGDDIFLTVVRVTK